MDPKDIQIVIFDGFPVDPMCLDWARSLCDVKMASEIWKARPIESDMAVWRNKACQWFLDETDKQAVLFLEHSKIPDAATLPVIESNADVVGACYCHRAGSEVHDSPGYIGTGCLRISREALGKIERPWFNYKLADDGLSVDQCSCMWFCQRAMAAGIFPCKAGSVGRIAKAVIRPAEDGAQMTLYDNIRSPNGDKS